MKKILLNLILVGVIHITFGSKANGKGIGIGQRISDLRKQPTATSVKDKVQEEVIPFHDFFAKLPDFIVGVKKNVTIETSDEWDLMVQKYKELKSGGWDGLMKSLKGKKESGSEEKLGDGKVFLRHLKHKFEKEKLEDGKASAKHAKHEFKELVEAYKAEGKSEAEQSSDDEEGGSWFDSLDIKDFLMQTFIAYGRGAGLSDVVAPRALIYTAIANSYAKKYYKLMYELEPLSVCKAAKFCFSQTIEAHHPYECILYRDKSDTGKSKETVHAYTLLFAELKSAFHHLDILYLLQTKQPALFSAVNVFVDLAIQLHYGGVPYAKLLSPIYEVLQYLALAADSFKSQIETVYTKLSALQYSLFVRLDGVLRLRSPFVIDLTQDEEAIGLQIGMISQQIDDITEQLKDTISGDRMFEHYKGVLTADLLAKQQPRSAILEGVSDSEFSELLEIDRMLELIFKDEILVQSVKMQFKQLEKYVPKSTDSIEEKVSLDVDEIPSSDERGVSFHDFNVDLMLLWDHIMSGPGKFQMIVSAVLGALALAPRYRLQDGVQYMVRGVYKKTLFVEDIYAARAYFSTLSAVYMFHMLSKDRVVKHFSPFLLKEKGFEESEHKQQCMLSDIFYGEASA